MLPLDSVIYGTATIHAVAYVMSCSPCLCFSFVHSLRCILKMLMNLGGSLSGRKESDRNSVQNPGEIFFPTNGFICHIRKLRLYVH